MITATVTRQSSTEVLVFMGTNVILGHVMCVPLLFQILQTVLLLVTVENRDVADKLHYVFLLHPSYA